MPVTELVITNPSGVSFLAQSVSSEGHLGSSSDVSVVFMDRDTALVTEWYGPHSETEEFVRQPDGKWLGTRGRSIYLYARV
jgi:hypothetical protein